MIPQYTAKENNEIIFITNISASALQCICNGAVTRCNFSSNFQLNCSSKLIVEVVTQYEFTIDFQLIKPIQYNHCMGKRHCDVMVLTIGSIENQMHFRFQSTFKLCFRLNRSQGTILV